MHKFFFPLRRFTVARSVSRTVRLNPFWLNNSHKAHDYADERWRGRHRVCADRRRNTSPLNRSYLPRRYPLFTWFSLGNDPVPSPATVSLI